MTRAQTWFCSTRAGDETMANAPSRVASPFHEASHSGFLFSQCTALRSHCDPIAARCCASEIA
jgi:hypothetical protein